jgi:hypothetical protein
VYITTPVSRHSVALRSQAARCEAAGELVRVYTVQNVLEAVKQPLWLRVCLNPLRLEAVIPACGRRVHCRGRRDSPSAQLASGLGAERIDQVFFVVLKSPKYAIRHVLAVRYEVRGEHLAFINTEGRLAAQFPIDTIQSWNVLPR